MSALRELLESICDHYGVYIHNADSNIWSKVGPTYRDKSKATAKALDLENDGHKVKVVLHSLSANSPLHYSDEVPYDDGQN